MSGADDRYIHIHGAREHNLKSVDVDIPIGKITVVTGPSGSGKTSLAMNTLYAEGQRRYVETFSPYVRQFMDRMERPNVDSVENILPAVALEQRNAVRNSRSTVGTMTGLNEYLKLIYSRLAEGHDADGRIIRPETPSSIADRLIAEGRDEALVCFGVHPAGAYDEMKTALEGQGYMRVIDHGVPVRLDDTDQPPCAGISVAEGDSIWVVVQDRVRRLAEKRSRLIEALETAMRLGGNVVYVGSSLPNDGNKSDWSVFRGDWHPLSEPVPDLFSSNSPMGACPECKGYGRIIAYDYLKGLRSELSIREGALKIFESKHLWVCREDLVRIAAARGNAVRTNVPWSELRPDEIQWVIDGEENENLNYALKHDLWYGIKGVFRDMEKHAHKLSVRVFLSFYRIYGECPSCRGGRLRPESLCFTVGGKTVPETMAMPMDVLLPWIDKYVVPFVQNDRSLEQAVKELRSRVAYLCEAGLPYITANRLTRSLSGGEIERVSLTSCLGAALTETLFVLDEPTVGLHPRDTGRLISAMERLRRRGNTLVVVEHEEALMRSADWLVDMGPCSGSSGGHLVYAGEPAGIEKVADSLTGTYLSGSRRIPVPRKRRKAHRFLRVRGAECHNLHHFDVDIPLGVYVCLTGVSGSGKSTLAREIVYAHAAEYFGDAPEEKLGTVRSIKGVEHVAQVVLVDQSPIVKTPRSAPAVYVGLFEDIRSLFAQDPLAKLRGVTPGYFSFNSGEGRCPRCGGLGQEKVEMQFLSDIFVPCALCGGSRYRAEALLFTWNGLNMQQVLSMDVRSAVAFFESAPGVRGKRIRSRLQILSDVGLGHLGLGQPLNTLSGGENQRLKLARILIDTALSEKSEKGHLLILDEPGTGLHFSDLELLLNVFRRLTEQGHSLLVIEHNTELIKAADWVIDLGPEGGEGGGHITAQGTPEEVAESTVGFTGKYLKAVLDQFAVLPEEKLCPDDAENVPQGVIALRGARHHQLKNIDVDIPRGKMTVVTGLSGSGKSTLAFDIIFAEGQKRFMDVMSPYARQFTEQMETPNIDRLTGLPPTVAIAQNRTRGGSKSTVGTVTEIRQFLRLLYAKLGEPHCPKCGVPVGKRSLEEVVAIVSSRAEKADVPLMLAAPMVRNRKGHYADLARWAENHGYRYLLADGRLIETEKFVPLDRYSNHDVDVVIHTVECHGNVFSLDGSFADDAALRNAVQQVLDTGEGFLRLIENGHAELHGLRLTCPQCGESFPEPEPSSFSFNSPRGWCPVCRGHGRIADVKFDSEKANSQLEAELNYDRDLERTAAREETSCLCPACHGSRLNPFALGVTLQGRNIAAVDRMNAREAREAIHAWHFSGRDAEIARNIVAEIDQRLDFLSRVGLDYLTLDRGADTLSGGETQRIRLAAQLGSNLRGVLYVLDEPTIGLHPCDNARLLNTLDALKQRGNTLLVVEHDEETMRRADYLIDLGPGAGIHGGCVTAQGSFDEIAAGNSPTGRTLREKRKHPQSGIRKEMTNADFTEIRGCTLHNLKNETFRIPKGCLTVITGVSGAGKTSFMTGTLAPAALEALGQHIPREERHWKKTTGLETFRAVYQVDQSPIGKTPRSAPVTYIGLFDEIRRLFAETPDARRLGFDAARFSFNTAVGRCETCKGTGIERREMDFLPPCTVPCETCRGKRFNSRTLQVYYKGKTIADVLDMSMEEAAVFFAAQPRLCEPFKLLCETGLGYLTLGQSSGTLSGGEAQRVKLAAELIKGRRAAMLAVKRGRPLPQDLYLIEEPTIGLHAQDVRLLVETLHKLVNLGNTVVVVEHNLDLIAEADYIIDMGPDAGENGGQIVAQGSPEAVASGGRGVTAHFLQRELGM